MIDKLIKQFAKETEIKMESLNYQDKPTLKAFSKWLVKMIENKNERLQKLEHIIYWYSEDSLSNVERDFDNEMKEHEEE